MKKFLISALLIASVFSVQAFTVPQVTAEACSVSYSWSQVSNYGESEWVCYYGGHQVYGWNYVNGVWYYMYPSTGYMAHDTFVNGWYVDSNGAWTDTPYVLQKIIDVVAHPGMIYDCGSEYECPIYISENQNFKYLCRYGWKVPDINGAVVTIGDGWEYFVADDGTVFRAPHQAYDTIYQYDSYGNIVKEYPYIENK